MGGVDKMDNMVANYRTRMRQRKWWWPIFAYLFDVSVVNAWLLMRSIHPEEPVCLSLLLFRRTLALMLLHSYGVKSSKGKIAPKWIIWWTIRKLIEDVLFVGKKSNFICSKCGVGLHPKICFKAYHTK